jgi:acetylornithine deacetylase/succinyl-diaminopimelate desuccinylase-like protein
MQVRAVVAAALLLCATAGLAQRNPDQRVQELLSSAAFRNATAFLESDHERFVRELITLTEIPAPPFKEQKRGAAFLEMLRAAKLTDLETDPEGNVMGIRKGTGGNGPMLAVLAHLDTVFPEGTDVTVKRNGSRILAPGVGDDTGALAMMLTVVRAMAASNMQTTSDVLFVGNVGEEGEGDLRGVKYLLQKGKYKDRIKSLISIDGGMQDGIVNGGLGSHRYRVTFSGPGGHSYGAFGLVNPAFALGNAMAKFSRLQVPATPRTTFNVGVVGGGTSVNSIPTAMFMLVDMRSESPDELRKLDEAFQRVVHEAVDEENRARSTAEGKITVDLKLIGDRPSGTTPTSAYLVQAAAAVIRTFGFRPSYEIGSTDANVPIAMGIPAVTIGRGLGGRSHALDEWMDVTKENNVQAGQVVLGTILAAAEAP